MVCPAAHKYHHLVHQQSTRQHYHYRQRTDGVVPIFLYITLLINVSNAIDIIKNTDILSTLSSSISVSSAAVDCGYEQINVLPMRINYSRTHGVDYTSHDDQYSYHMNVCGVVNDPACAQSICRYSSDGSIGKLGTFDDDTKWNYISDDKSAGIRARLWAEEDCWIGLPYPTLVEVRFICSTHNDMTFTAVPSSKCQPTFAINSKHACIGGDTDSSSGTDGSSSSSSSGGNVDDNESASSSIMIIAMMVSLLTIFMISLGYYQYRRSRPGRGVEHAIDIDASDAVNTEL